MTIKLSMQFHAVRAMALVGYGVGPEDARRRRAGFPA
jgi:hypothetical protein